MTDFKQGIKDILSSRDLYEQLAEESAELAKAALKVIRASGATKNVTPVSMDDAWDSLVEEVRDVLIVLEALGFNIYVEADWARASGKWERWYRRISDGEEHHPE